MHITNAPIIAARRDRQVNDRVYVAYQTREGGDLIRMWIGTVGGGPTLQYDVDGTDKWDGRTRRDFPRGAWAPMYSRGDYGRNCACGGHWSSHSRYVCTMSGVAGDSVTPCVAVPAESGADITLMPVPPDSVEPDITITDIDCSGGWAIWYETAHEALAARLPAHKIRHAKLPRKCIDHLTIHETAEDIDRLREVIEAYNL